jgi:hypothetical protein
MVLDGPMTGEAFLACLPELLDSGCGKDVRHRVPG